MSDVLTNLTNTKSYLDCVSREMLQRLVDYGYDPNVSSVRHSVERAIYHVDDALRVYGCDVLKGGKG